MLTTFNCGIGFMLIVDEAAQDKVTGALSEAGEDPRVIGRIVPSTTEPTSSQILCA